MRPLIMPCLELLPSTGWLRLLHPLQVKIVVDSFIVEDRY